MRAALILALTPLLALQARAAGPPLGPLTPGQAAPGFAQVEGPRVFHFPADHGPHPAFRQEWWYVTGNLDATAGQRFGFELTFFRVALAPPQPHTPAAGPRSSWRAREIYTAHFAVTDVERQHLWYSQKWSRAAMGLAGATAEPFAVWIDDWSIRAVPGHPTSWRLSAPAGPYSLSLELEPLTPPILNGPGGFSRKSSEPGSASYYYSLPRMSVHGKLQRGGRVFTVHGLAWLDREWGSGTLGHNEVGWDWFGLQLTGGTDLMFYAMRNRDGSRDPASAGTWVGQDGRAQGLASHDVELDVLQHWSSPRGDRYPSRWHLRVPEKALDIDIVPVVADQLLGTLPSYWEGAVDVRGTLAGRAIGGRGYVELVGYGRNPQ